jgi:hypothetical protein
VLSRWEISYLRVVSVHIPIFLSPVELKSLVS